MTLQRLHYEAASRIKRIAKETALSAFGVALDRVDAGAHRELLRGFFARNAPVRTEHELERFGTDPGDGGYLVPDDLAGIDTCFSPGVSNVAEFELGLAARGIRSHLADYSVEAPPVEHPLLDFEKKFLGTRNDAVFMTLESWVERLARPADRDMLLQMDIEGAEYDVLFDAPAAVLERFRIIVIEFHRLDNLFNTVGFKLIDGVFSKLAKSFAIVHLHPNNFSEPVQFLDFTVPPVMEITFLRRDRIARPAPLRQFPHRLDSPCAPWRRDYAVPACWYPQTPA